MNCNYLECSQKWNTIFNNIKEYDIDNIEYPDKKINVALNWLNEGTNSVIDFGCGYGKVLISCLKMGCNKVCGIDISDKAISIANNVLIKSKYNQKFQCKFICGGINELKKIPSQSFDSAILFNILDSLYPNDSILLIKEIHRILKPNGKLLIKLNSYVQHNVLIDDWNYSCIDTNLYQGTEGLILYNINDTKIRQLISPYFRIYKYDYFNVEDLNISNRLFYLYSL